MSKEDSEDKVLNKKRERNSSSEETDVVYKPPEKKSKISEGKKDKEKDKERTSKNDITYFMACIALKFEKSTFNEKDKLKGEYMNFNFRRKKAVEIIESITKEEKDKLKLIEKSLSYDNTSKYGIYRLLKHYRDKSDKDKFNDAVKKYKYCITQKFEVSEKDNDVVFIDLNELYDVADQLEEQEELPNRGVQEDNISDLRNFLVDIFTNYYYVAENISRKIKILSDKDLNEVLTIKLKMSDDNDEIEELNFDTEKKMKIFEKYKDDTKTEDINELFTFMESFMSKYIFLKNFENFQKNQPVSHENNLTLYYYYIMYSLYNISIKYDEKGEKILIKKEKLLVYLSLKKFHDLVFDKFFDSKDQINETINYLLQYLLFALSGGDLKYLYFLVDGIHTKKVEKFLDHRSADDLAKNLNENFSLINAVVEKDKLYFEEDDTKDKIEIKYKNYLSKLVSDEVDVNINDFNWIYNSVKFETFQNGNFFLEIDIKYLKYLIKHILTSELFKQIFDNYSNVSEVSDYYFDEPKNVDDFVDRIIFLPFKYHQLNKYSYVDKNILSIIVPAFPENNINYLDEYRLYRLMELSLRVIVISFYEAEKFIKYSYNMITKGKISGEENSNLFMEEILFGWTKNEESELNLEKLEISKNIKYKNDMIKKRRIDLVTAIKLLNPDIYNKDINYFRKSIYEISKEDLKNFKIKDDFEEEYKNYLEGVISEDMIKTYWKSNLSINAEI